MKVKANINGITYEGFCRVDNNDNIVLKTSNIKYKNLILKTEQIIEIINERDDSNNEFRVGCVLQKTIEIIKLNWEIERIKSEFKDFITKIKPEVTTVKKELTLDNFGINNSLRYIIVKDDDGLYHFVFQNVDNNCISHAQLDESYTNINQNCYTVAGGFYSHKFETFTDDNLVIEMNFYGASSTFRKPTNDEINGAIENYKHWRKDYMKFNVL